MNLELNTLNTVDVLLEGVDYELLQGVLPQFITGIALDSRVVQPGAMFVAICGTQTDGHTYITQAVDAGASVIVVSRSLDYPLWDTVSIIRVGDTVEALWKLARVYYRNPSESLKVIGVTGTNGKTTTATLLWELSERLGKKAGLISTVEVRVGNHAEPSERTTPDSLELNRLLALMVANGCEYVFMEVSSHAVVQRRIAGLTFAGGVFTNLTRDHLDYHGSMAEYRDAKKGFFDMLPKGAFALYNGHDRHGSYMVQNTKAKKLKFNVEGQADYKGRMVEEGVLSSDVEIQGVPITVRLAGLYNLYNLAAVYGVADLLGLTEDEDFFLQFSALSPVRGRFECVPGPKGRIGVVDYAHTPDALLKVIETARHIVELRDKRVHIVVGAGGNRDAGKRQDMGAVSTRGTCWVVLTSDNPRMESPMHIIDEMFRGITQPDRARVFRIEDRRKAIEQACMLSEPGDIVLVAGKGHETYQEIKGERRHFDDREELVAAFGKLEEEVQ